MCVLRDIELSVFVSLSQYYGDLKGVPYDSCVSGDNWETVSFWSTLLSKIEHRYGVTEAEEKGMHDAVLHSWNYLSMGASKLGKHKRLLYIFNAPGITGNRLCCEILSICRNLLIVYFIVMERTI